MGVFQFKYNTLVSEACQIIRDREPGADTGDSESIISFCNWLLMRWSLIISLDQMGYCLELAIISCFVTARSGLCPCARWIGFHFEILCGMCVKWNVFNSANWIMIIYFLSVTEYGLFKPDEDAKKGTWLDPRRTLEYYLFRAGVGALKPSLMSVTSWLNFIPMKCWLYLVTVHA